MEEFMNVVRQIYGEKVLIQFEDFANHNAFDLLAKYSKSHLVFNDDIQGTTSVVLTGLLASLEVVGGTLAEHTYLFLGVGEWPDYTLKEVAYGLKVARDSGREEAFPVFLLMQRLDEKAHLFTRIRCDRSSSCLSLS